MKTTDFEHEANKGHKEENFHFVPSVAFVLIIPICKRAEKGCKEPV